MTTGASPLPAPRPTAPTLPAALERAAAHPEVVVRFLDAAQREEVLTWAEIRERASAAAGGLGQLGVRRAERVALVHPTSPEFVISLFAVLLAGGVPVPLYPPVRLGRLDEYHRRTAAMLEAAGARLVLADARVRRILGETLERARPPLGCLRLADLEPLPAEAVDVRPDDLGLVQFSSGTTVDPKPVALSHRALMAQVAALNSHWPDRDGVVHSGFCWLPLYHDMGLVGCLFSALERPGDLTLVGPEVFVARPAIWLRGLSRYRATVSPAPNFAYALCLEKVRDEELDGVDLSSWRVALNGAEAVSPRVLRAFVRRFARWGLSPEALTPVYGLSEAALAVTFSRIDSVFTSRTFERGALAGGQGIEAEDGVEIVSLGRPLPGFELELRDADGGVVGPRQVGRLWVRGPSLMDGYLGRPEASARVLVDGWLDTGDLGLLVDGELYLVGRAKDLIILRGRNHLPDEIERSVDGVPGARKGCAAAVGYLPEDGEREELVLLVEHRQRATPEELEAMPQGCRKAVLQATGLALDLVEVLAPGTLPRTSSGKIRRGEALALFRGGNLEPPAPVNALTLGRALARSQVARLRSRWRGRDGEPDGG